MGVGIFLSSVILTKPIHPEDFLSIAAATGVYLLGEANCHHRNSFQDRTRMIRTMKI